MAEVSAFMAFAQSDVLTSRFDFQTHGFYELWCGFSERLPETAFRANPGDATIDVSSARGPGRAPGWITHAPGRWAKLQLEPI